MKFLLKFYSRGSFKVAFLSHGLSLARERLSSFISVLVYIHERFHFVVSLSKEKMPFGNLKGENWMLTTHPSANLGAIRKKIMQLPIHSLAIVFTAERVEPAERSTSGNSPSFSHLHFTLAAKQICYIA